MKSFPSVIRIATLFSTVIACSFMAYAQGDPGIAALMQLAPAKANNKLPVPYGYVDLGSGNLHLSIPYKTLAAPNGHSNPMFWEYNSRTWQRTDYPTASFWGPTEYFGWIPRSSDDWNFVTSQKDDNVIVDGCGNTNNQYPHWSNFALTNSSGTHVFPIEFQMSCNQIGGGGAGYAVDGSGYYADAKSDVYGAPDTMKIWSAAGDLVYSGYAVQGAFFSIDSNGTSLGAVPSSYDTEWANMQNAATASTEYVNVPYSVLSDGWGSVGTAQTSINTVKTFTLPDGRQISLTYDVCPNSQQCSGNTPYLGTLKSMTLPTGGTVTFNYGVFTVAGGETTIAEIRVTSVSYSGERTNSCDPTATSGTTWVLCWDTNELYNSRTFTGVSVLEPTGTNGSRSLSVRTIAGAGWAGWNVTGVKTYGGSAAAGTPIEESFYSNFVGGDPMDVSIWHDGVLVSKTHYARWDWMLPMVSSMQQQDASGNILSEMKYTFQSSLMTSDHPGLLANHYVDRPQTMRVYGAGGSSGTAVAGANFYYDGNPLSTTSGFNSHSVTGLSWHDDTNFGSGMASRGNLTSVERMSAGSGYVTTNTMSYNILGQLVSSIDGNGNTTQHDWYSDSFGDSTCASSTQFFFDTAIKNAKNQQSRTIYDSCTGTVHAQKNANDIAANRNGTVFGYDAGGRLTSTNLPNGGSATVQYTDGGNSSVTTTVQVANGKTTQSITHLDAFGRTTQTEQVVADADGGNVKTDINVDFSGAPAAVHGPYAINKPGGTTAYVYDALHRTKSTSRQGVTQSQVTYNGLTTTTQDGRSNSTVTTNNLLGQLTSTTEASGLLTEYGYDALGNLNSVTQHGNGSETAVTRGFSYDPLSRLVKAYNPESGWTCYGSLSSGTKPNGTNCSGDASHTGYDGNNNLVQKTDARGVVTHFGYDPLNRLRSRGTGAATAINSCYLYDTDTATNPTESLGLLVAEWTQLGSCGSNSTVPTGSGVKTVHKIGAYDQVGRVLSESNCVMGSCSVSRGQTYHYNLDGSLKDAGNGMGSANALTMGYDSAGRLSSYSASAFGAQANLGFRYSPVGWTWGSMGRSIFLEREFDLFNRVTGMTAKPWE